MTPDWMTCSCGRCGTPYVPRQLNPPRAESFKTAYPLSGVVEAVQRLPDGRAVRRRRAKMSDYVNGPWWIDVVDRTGATVSHRFPEWTTAVKVYRALLNGEAVPR